MQRSLFSILLFSLAWLAGPAWGSATARYALVIGNASYDSAPLANPLNDASDMADKLEQRGFQVTKLLDADKRQMEDAIYQFTRNLGGEGSVGLFYFAGHGLEIDGENYLVPVKAQLRDETDGRYRTVRAGELLDRMNSANKGVNLVILDACRDNPFKRGWRSLGNGLAQMRPAKGTLILYATEPHKKAADGSGRNGVFTEYLLRVMDEPGVPVEMAFKKVSAEVEEQTRGEQVPWFEGIIHGQFYFHAPTRVQIQSPAPTPQQIDSDGLAWQAAIQCARPECYRVYLQSHPEGRFAAMARAMLTPSRPAAPASLPAESPADEERALGLQRQERRTIQQALNALGHPVGSADGIWGGNTRNGIRAWQRTAGLEASGYLNGESYKQLMAEAAPKLAVAQASQTQAQAEAEPKAQAAEARKRQPRAQVETAGKAEEVERRHQAEGAEAKERQAHQPAATASYEPEMLPIPSGSFDMGCVSGQECGDEEKPVHRVRLGTFKIGKYEVTQAQWRAVMGNNPSRFKNCDDCPVEQVSWDDVQKYIEKLNRKTGKRYRLPSEAEWEYAARAGTRGAFSFRGEISTDKANYDGRYIGRFREKTLPVGSFPANSWGLHDVHGNVWEWVQDCWNDSYFGAPTDGSAWESDDCRSRVLRGGAWSSISWHLRAANRSTHYGDIWIAGPDGFRLARD